MFRNRNKKLRLIGLIALALVLSLGGFAAVFAAGEPIVADNESDLIDATLTKVLKTPLNTTLPAGLTTYTFKFTKVSVDSGSLGLGDMPAIADKQVSFTSSTLGVTDGDTITYTSELTPGIFGALNFPAAGIYIYKITEMQTQEDLNTNKVIYANSDAEYNVSVYVKKKSDGSNDLYIYAISARIVVQDYEDQGEVGDKVDPTPGWKTAVEGDYSQMTFTNTYIKKNGGEDPTDPDPEESSIIVSKAISGSEASTTRYFAFKVTVTRPSIAVAPDVFKGYVVSSANTIVTNSDNGAVVTDAAGNYIEFATGVETDVYLQAGQRLVFVDAPIGSSYVASEPGTEGYVPKVSIVVNGATPIAIPDVSDTALLPGASLTTDLRYIGAAENSAAFTNTYSDDPPTGIIMNNLPYFLLIVLAAGALATFAIIRNRRKKSGSYR
ncbi:MAG: hypothetical protein LBC58_05555 [Clostridiales Family XIII bacterium]|jgi:hypothetical protein|nr:hypothetical protein [Clostridiales Family XIII bacterium]